MKPDKRTADVEICVGPKQLALSCSLTPYQSAEGKSGPNDPVNRFLQDPPTPGLTRLAEYDRQRWPNAGFACARHRSWNAFTAEAIVRSSKEGYGFPDGTIRGARLRAGIITGRLNLTLADGRSVRLLWAKSSLTYDLLRDALSRSLGDGLQLD